MTDKIKVYGYYSPEDEIRVCYKMLYIVHLLYDIAELKSEVRKLKNHPINHQWETLQDFAACFQMRKDEEILHLHFMEELYQDFKNTRNKKLKVKIEHVYQQYKEILAGNFDYDYSYFTEKLKNEPART